MILIIFYSLTESPTIGTDCISSGSVDEKFAALVPDLEENHKQTVKYYDPGVVSAYPALPATRTAAWPGLTHHRRNNAVDEGKGSDSSDSDSSSSCGIRSAGVVGDTLE